MLNFYANNILTTSKIPRTSMISKVKRKTEISCRVTGDRPRFFTHGTTNTDNGTSWFAVIIRKKEKKRTDLFSLPKTLLPSAKEVRTKRFHKDV